MSSNKMKESLRSLTDYFCKIISKQLIKNISFPKLVQSQVVLPEPSLKPQLCSSESSAAIFSTRFTSL